MTLQDFQNKPEDATCLSLPDVPEALECYATDFVVSLLTVEPTKLQDIDMRIRELVDPLNKSEADRLLFVISRRGFSERCADEAGEKSPECSRQELLKLSEHVSAKISCVIIDHAVKTAAESLEAVISQKDGEALRETNALVHRDLSGILEQRASLGREQPTDEERGADLCARGKCLECAKGSEQRREMASIEKLGDYFESLFTSLPPLHRDALERDRYMYGAKGANLLALASAVRSLEPFFRGVLPQVQVPPFTLIPTEIYRWHEAGEDVSELLREAHKWVGDRQVMVRSSAVHSEDGEHLGAGIYESFLLPPSPSFEVFVDAVRGVYNSLSAPMAVEYRHNLGLTQSEQMGIVVQEFIAVGDKDAAGHIDTVRPRIPSVIDVVSQKRQMPIFRLGGVNQIENIDATVIPFRKDRLMLDILKPRRLLEPAMLFSEDYTKEFRGFKAAMLARVGLLVERYFGNAVQIEYVSQGNSVFLVQVRPLPETWTTPAEAVFPGRNDWLWEGRSLGVMAEELEILGDSPSNFQRRGVVIFDSAFQASLDMPRLERLLPKEGAVVVLEESGEMAGHIESRCLERGLTIIGPLANRGKISSCGSFDRFSRVYGCSLGDVFDRAAADGPAVLPPNEKLSKLLVVSTGLEARLYPAE